MNLLIKVSSTGPKGSDWETDVQALRKFRRARAESSQIDGRALGRGDDLAICADLERDMIADTCGNNCSRSLSPPLYFVRTHAGNDLRECGLSFFADNGAWLAL